MYTSRDQLGRTTVTFTVDPSVAARSAALCGEWDGWSPLAMHRDEVGGFFVTIQLATGRSYRYRYLIDGSRWENDWYADRYEPNDLGGQDSVVDLGPAPARAQPTATYAHAAVVPVSAVAVAEAPAAPAPVTAATTAPAPVGEPIVLTPVAAVSRRHRTWPWLLAAGVATVAAAVTAVVLAVDRPAPTPATTVDPSVAAAYETVVDNVASAIATEQDQLHWVTSTQGVATPAQIRSFTLPLAAALRQAATEVAALAIPVRDGWAAGEVVASLNQLASDEEQLANHYPDAETPGLVATATADTAALHAAESALAGALAR